MRPVRPALAAMSVAMALAATASAAGKDDRLPFPLLVDVAYAQAEDGPEGWRRELEGWLLSTLEAERCYTRVRHVRDERPDGRYLQIDISVDGYEERQVYEVGQSALYDPDNPPEIQKAFTLRAEADFTLAFRAMPEGATLRSKKFRLVGAHRPVFDEDPRYAVRQQLTEGVFKSVRGIVCGLNEKKLTREIEKAKAEAEGRAAR
jgi:hypothetical protein